MPITVPNIIRSYARGGGSIVFALDIEPSAVDGWTTKRFATASVDIAGDAYEEATLGGLPRIGFEAKVIQGGNVAVLPDVDVRLLNKAKLHEEFVTDIIEGRRATVRMTAIGPNICLNSSFEKRSGADFEDWTEVPGAGGGTVTAETGTVYDGSAACKLTGGTAGSCIISDPLTWRIGSKVVVSCYARTSAGTATLKAAVHATSALWYDATAKTFGASRVLNTLGVANSTGWQRFYLEMDWKDLYAALSGTGLTLLVDQPFFVELWCEPSETVIVDAVQIELNNQLTPYNHNRYELIEADAVTVFSGIVKNPAWSADEISISLESWNSNKHRNIPVTILTDATDATWTVPKGSIGKPFPMTYGDFTSDGERPWNQKSATLQNMARGLTANVDPIVISGIVVYFDRPGIDLYHPSGIYRLFAYFEDVSEYDEQMDYDLAAYSYDDQEMIDDLAVNARFKQSSNPRFLPMRKMPLMQALNARSYLREYPSSVWGDTENVLDGIDTTFTWTAEANTNVLLYCGLRNMRCNNENILRDSANLSASPYLCIFALVDAKSYAPFSGDTSLRLKAWGPTDSDSTFLTTDGVAWLNQSADIEFRNVPMKRTGSTANKNLTEINVQPDFSLLSTELPTPAFGETVWVDSYGAIGLEVRVYECGVLIYYFMPIEDVSFTAQLFGRTFGTTWNSRKTAANMVESAPEIIESILREELGAADADINETLFDASDTARAYPAAGQLHEVKNSMDVVKDICDEYGLLYYVDILGKHSLVNLDWRPVTKHLFLRDWYKPFDKVKISYTPRAEIVNDIILHYDRNQFTGEYRKVAFCNKDAASGSIAAAYITKCADSYAELGNAVQTLEINADWIKDTATAEAMVCWTIDWLYKQRIIISGDLFLDNLDLTFGDVVDVDLEPLLPKSFTSTARFMAISSTISRTNSRIGVKLLEVKEP